MTLPRASWHDTRQVTVCLLPRSLVFGEHCLYTRTKFSSTDEILPVLGRIVVLNSPKVGTSNMAPAVGLVPVMASLILYPWKNKLVIITLNYSHRKNVIYSDYDKIPNTGRQTPAISKRFVIVVTYISNMVTITSNYINNLLCATVGDSWNYKSPRTWWIHSS